MENRTGPPAFHISIRIAAIVAFAAFAGASAAAASWSITPMASIAVGARMSLQAADEYAIGADLSFLKQQEDAGKRFKDQGVAKPGLAIFRSHGYNWVRLRLFHTPANSPVPLPNTFAYTVNLAKQAKAQGFRFLLDFHYSDTWADPGAQSVPKAWAGLAHARLVDSVFAYTRDAIAGFRAEGVLPDMVQVGNEINNGMLWPDGKDDWDNQADLLEAGIHGVDAGRGADPMPRIMLHIACGGDTAVTKWFFDNAEKSGIAYDVIGQSYYPMWHGTLDDLARNLAFMAGRYAKDILVVETAFAAYPEGGGPFPLTDAGQADYLREIDRIVRAAPGGRGKGWMWWEPTGDAYLGTSRGLFDRQLNARPALRVFDGSIALRPRSAVQTAFRPPPSVPRLWLGAYRPDRPDRSAGQRANRLQSPKLPAQPLFTPLGVLLSGPGTP
jgi:arabinogalactan endo-1,4-beta-galactosidase